MRRMLGLSPRRHRAATLALAAVLVVPLGTAVGAPGASKRATIKVSDRSITLPAGGLHTGINSLRILGSGTGRHHLAFWRLNPGVTYAQFDALLNSNTGDPETVSALEGGNGSVAPGTPVNVFLVLPAGQYAITDLVQGNVTTEIHTTVAQPGRVRAPRSIGRVDARPKVDRYRVSRGFGRPGVYEFRNLDRETHELGLVKLAPGKSVKDLIKWAKAGGKGKPPGRPIGGFGALHGGGHGWLALPRLAPGRYALACFVPDAQGVPHVAMGMAAGFTR
jgi:hypothetical protein